MLKWWFPRQSKTYQPYSEQSILVAISYFRAQQIAFKTKEARSFIILSMGLFKFILTFDEAQLRVTRMVIAQNAFQVKNGDLVIFLLLKSELTAFLRHRIRDQNSRILPVAH